MTGTMNPQGKGGGILSPSELSGTFAAATTRTGSSGVDPLAANLLLTFGNTGTCNSNCVNGTLYDNASPAGTPLVGTIQPNTFLSSGYGPIALTSPSAQNYAIYVVDTSGACSLSNLLCVIQDFLMIDEDKTNPNPSVIFARQ